MRLQVYAVMLEVLRLLVQVLREIERKDVDLYRQLRRAATSALLNLAEGEGSSGGTRMQRFQTALGSARETKACLEAADALGYCAAPEEVMKGLDRVIGMTVRLIYRR